MLANALRGLSDVTSIMIISFVAYFLVAMAVGYTIAFPCSALGISGVWLSYPIGFTCSVLLLGLRAPTSCATGKRTAHGCGKINQQPHDHLPRTVSLDKAGGGSA